MKPFKELAIQETLDTMQENQVNIFDNPFRLGSEMFFHTIQEARRLHLEGSYNPTAVDKNLLETDLGEFAEFDGQHVPLDCPMHEEKEPELLEQTCQLLREQGFRYKIDTVGSVNFQCFQDRDTYSMQMNIYAINENFRSF